MSDASEQATQAGESGEKDPDRPRPGPGDPGSDQAPPDSSDSSGEGGEGGEFTYGEDESQDFVDRSTIDFDPADGLYTGSAVSGDSDIPGPSEGDIRSAQEELGEDQGNNAGAKAAAEKFIDENDVDVEKARQGEAIAGSAQGTNRDSDKENNGDDE